MIIYICTSEILKTRVYNRFLGTQYLFVFVLAGREYKMDIVLSKNGVKCAVFKISDVQVEFRYCSINAFKFFNHICIYNA